jgi:hypothetical protein
VSLPDEMTKGALAILGLHIKPYVPQARLTKIPCLQQQPMCGFLLIQNGKTVPQPKQVEGLLVTAVITKLSK